jgi:hypothetical protein
VSWRKTGMWGYSVHWDIVVLQRLMRKKIINMKVEINA